MCEFDKLDKTFASDLYLGPIVQKTISLNLD